MTINNRLKQLRKLKNLTQKQFVEDKYSVTYVSQIEKGNLQPSEQFLHTIAVLHHFPIEYLQCEDSSLIEQITAITKQYEEKEELSDNERILLEMSKKNSYSVSVLLQIYITLLRFYTKNNDFKSGEQILQFSLDFLPKEIDSYNETFDYYIAIGTYFYNHHYFMKAEKYYKLANQLVDDDEISKKAKICYNLALVKLKTSRHKKQNTWYAEKAISLYTELNDTEKVIHSMLILSIQYRKSEMYEENLHILTDTEVLISEINSDYLTSLLNNHYGEVYKELGKYEQALSYFQKDLDYEKPFSKERIHSLHSVINIYIILKDWEKASNYLDEAINIVNRYSMMYDYIEIYRLNAQMHLAKGIKCSMNKK